MGNLSEKDTRMPLKPIELEVDWDFVYSRVDLTSSSGHFTSDANDLLRLDTLNLNPTQIQSFTNGTQNFNIIAFQK